MRRRRLRSLLVGLPLAVVAVGVGVAERAQRPEVPAQAAAAAQPRVRRLVRHAFSWPRSTPEAQGLDGAVVASYRRAVAAGEYGAIDSLLVIRHGVLVEESYFRGWEADELHRCYSVTKSVTSLLVGIARERGLLAGLDADLLGFFPEYPDVAHLTAGKRAITLDDLLTMRAGLDWHELDRSYDDPSNSVLLMAASPDWVKYVLDRRMVAPPGTRFEYSSGCTVLLGGILRNVSGRQPHELCRDWLFAPLEIAAWRWELAAPALSNCGWGLHLRPLDMAKLGELVLRGGRWRGLRLVDEEWLTTATAAHADPGGGFGYGYQWWRMPLAGDEPDGALILFAWGWGGQFIFIVPSLDAVVVSTASCYDGACSGAIDLVRPLLAAATHP